MRIEAVLSIKAVAGPFGVGTIKAGGALELEVSDRVPAVGEKVNCQIMEMIEKYGLTVGDTIKVVIQHDWEDDTLRTDKHHRRNR